MGSIGERGRYIVGKILRKLWLTRQYILHCDGGICSQINQYAIGRLIEEETGITVKYDLDWYRYDGKDLIGNANRKYLLNKVFDGSIQIKKACLIESKIYKNFFSDYWRKIGGNVVNLDLEKIVLDVPGYLGDYYSANYKLFGERKIDKYIKLIDANGLDEKNQKIAEEIKNNYSVGIHIRRGDMAEENLYWKVPNISYFINAIKTKEFVDADFYLFSDDPEWTKNVLIPQLPIEGRYHIVENNSNSEGYKDLLLLAACNHQIASQGTFGIFGYYFNKNVGKILVVPAEGERLQVIKDMFSKEDVRVFCFDGTKNTFWKKD